MKVIAFVLGFLASTTASAEAWGADCDLDEVVCYTLVDTKTIEGRIEENMIVLLRKMAGKRMEIRSKRCATSQSFGFRNADLIFIFARGQAFCR
jgi:hypothetical protein